MKSYPSMIDGHAISCKPLPTECNDSNAAFIRLCRLPIQGSINALKKAPQTKTLTVNGIKRVFTLGKNFEYYNGKQSLTDAVALPNGMKGMKITIR